MNLNFLKKIDLYKSSLIDYSNLISGLLTPQDSFFKKFELDQYNKNYSKGIPMLLPFGLNYFEYIDEDYFILNKEDIANVIFSIKNPNYIGVKRLISNGIKFASNGKPKKKYIKVINHINSYNYYQKKIITNYSKKGYKIAAFQTRNFPHFGHEAIINYLLSKVDYVVVNPLVGPKKKDDVNYEALIKAYKYLIDKKFNSKVLILPAIVNMFYAGPREACHHAIVRKNLGFTHFIVGRDHAGAENIYNENLSSIVTKRFEKKLKIKIIGIDGAVYCIKCKKSVIKGFCDHSSDKLFDISGSKFRYALNNKKYYKYADIDLQDFLLKNDFKLFQS